MNVTNNINNYTNLHNGSEQNQFRKLFLNLVQPEIRIRLIVSRKESTAEHNSAE